MFGRTSSESMCIYIYICALGKRNDLRQMQMIKIQMVHNTERTNLYNTVHVIYLFLPVASNGYIFCSTDYSKVISRCSYNTIT